MTQKESEDLAVLLGQSFPLAHPARMPACQRAFMPFAASVVRECIERHRMTSEHLDESALLSMVRSRAADARSRWRREVAQARKNKSAEAAEKAAADESFTRTCDRLRRLPPAVLEERQAAIAARFSGRTRDRLAHADPYHHPVLAALLAAEKVNQ